MANVDGEWDTVTKTPMGDQRSTLTVISDGDTFTGSQAGPMGSLVVEDGKVDGNKLSWTMNMTIPFPMKLEVSAIIDGDSLIGEVKAGAFGVSPMSGSRKA